MFGGKDERSQDFVQGFTSAGFYFDEVTLMPESFVNQAVVRCSAEGSKLWFNCNPESPYHWFKLNWIEKLEKNYISQDIGLTAKAIIDTYCSPLTSNNINTATGIIAPVQAMDKTPLKVFEELRRQHGIYYFVDAN